MSKIAEILRAYNYNVSRPLFSMQGLSVYDAQNKENGLKFTIKIYRRSDSELASYLQKLKSAGSDYVIKIYEIYNQPETNQMLIIQQHAAYGILANALTKCKRLDDDDALMIIKSLLNGHIDMLRASVFWTGLENDIEITQNGIKLSWNNSIVFSQNNENPFPGMIQRLAFRQSTNSILPFPNSKMINDLIKVSRQNASEMSLHPLLKKRQKIYKKKGKGWLGLKEYKVKGQYWQQLSYTAVSLQYGFVRIKVFEKGTINPGLLKMCQTRAAFCRILDFYEEGDSQYFVSEYANDGSVQSYVKRLKANGVQLKQNHIEFIFFSLIQPLKFINNSEVTSLNMLHIKNIYLEDGIPKIGEPIPLNSNLSDVLKERSDVPDFYHKQFKEQPETRNPKYDTYSLGVLLYKLMYTQYPIFPQGNVHIPTTPSYKKNLKDALMLFLNRGGDIKDLQNELQVSDDVKNQVKMNQRIIEGKVGNINMMQQQLIDQKIDQLSAKEEEPQVQNKDCFGKLYHMLNTRGKDEENKYYQLHTSSYSLYRRCTATLVILGLYFFAFFLPYLIGFFNLISNTRLFYPLKINVLGQSHKVIVPNYDTFLNAFSALPLNSNLTGVTQTLGCLIDDKGSYYDFIRPVSPHWYIYLFTSLLAMIIILIIKSIQVSQFSLVRVGYHYYDQTMNGANQSRFVLSSYVMFQLWFSICLYAFFFLFNFIFLQQQSPCLGGKNWSSLTQSLFTDRIDFSVRYLSIILGTFLLGVLSFSQITCLFSRISYNSLINPIFIFVPFYLALFIMMRIGAYSTFSPSFLNNQQGLIANSYVNFIGYFPQILLIVEIPICYLIDLLFYKQIEPKIEKFVGEESFGQMVQFK